jgi:hypothetical protein
VVRKGVAGTTYEPVHGKIQNAMKALLSREHGAKFVTLEKDGVDVRLTVGGTTVFYEIKTHPTAKACVREALGQLLEYAIYPMARRADKLVIVGGGKPTGEDLKYVKYLRALLPLPVYYCAWDWKTRHLGPEC